MKEDDIRQITSDIIDSAMKIHETLRLGIDETGQRVRVGSPVERISREVKMRYPGLAARMRECMTSPHHSSKEMDFAFFRMVVEDKL